MNSPRSSKLVACLSFTMCLVFGGGSCSFASLVFAVVLILLNFVTGFPVLEFVAGNKVAIKSICVSRVHEQSLRTEASIMEAIQDSGHPHLPLVYDVVRVRL